MPIQTLILHTEVNESGFYTIEAGQVLSFKIELDSFTKAIDVAIVHDNINQHYSLRCWVSKKPNSSSVGFPHPAVHNWHPMQQLQHIVRCQTESTDLPRFTYPLGLDEGEYWVNVENLPNSSNAFYIRLTEVE